MKKNFPIDLRLDLGRYGLFWLNVIFFVLDMGGYDVFWLGVVGCDLFFDLVWVGVGEFDLILAGCGWVWVSVTIYWLYWLGVGQCDLFLTGCG